MSWIFIALAIACEVTATAILRLASDGKRGAMPIVWIGYIAAFVFLSASLRAGMNLGVAYGVWTAVGVAITAIISKFVFKEPLNRIMVAGIALIGLGVLFVEMGGAH